MGCKPVTARVSLITRVREPEVSVVVCHLLAGRALHEVRKVCLLSARLVGDKEVSVDV